MAAILARAEVDTGPELYEKYVNPQWVRLLDQILAEDAGRQSGGECQMLINCNPSQVPRA
jgi:hypothetical protein